MKQWLCTISLSFLVSALLSCSLSAQPKAITSIWSFNGIGVGYEHYINEDCFLQADAEVDMSDLLIGRSHTVGASASFSYNIIFKTKVNRYGTRLNYFAGPGAKAGWGMDYKSAPGLFFGIKGRLGIEAIFERSISISACLSPTLGLHVSEHKGDMVMRLYRNGLRYFILPEIGIKYTF